LTDEVSFWKWYKTLILFLIGLIVVFSLTYALRSVVLPFLVGLVLAYLLLPMVKWAECKLPPKDKWMEAKRVFLIILVFILTIILLVLFAIYVYLGVRDSFSNILSQAPQYISDGLDTIQQRLESFREIAPPEYQQQIDSALGNISIKLGGALQGVFTSGIALVPATIGMIAGFLSLPFFLFFLLKDSESLGTGFYSLLPVSLATHARNIFKIMDNVLGKYIRAQVMLASVIAIFVFTGLSILGIKLAPALAIFAGIMEIIPVIGPWVAGIFGVLVTLAIAPSKIIWVALVYILANLLENLFLVPRIQGGFLRINHAILRVVLVVGASLGGIWGMVLAAPLTALVVEIYKYIRSSTGAAEATQIMD
jgi:predicted PurR-regulated permease PerM